MFILLVIPVLGACVLCGFVTYAIPQEILTAELGCPNGWREYTGCRAPLPPWPPSGAQNLYERSQ